MLPACSERTTGPLSAAVARRRRVLTLDFFYPTERALSVIDEVQTVCEKTEALLLQGMSESEQNLFMDFLIQAGRNITSELHIEKKGEEFND